MAYSPVAIIIGYPLAVTRGMIAGAKGASVFGFNADVDNANETVWPVGGQYVFPPAGGIQMEIVSASAGDTAAAGAGARTVQIHYLDAAYAEQIEVIALNGVTPVPTVATNILRINYMNVITAGSNGAPIGNIDLRNIVTPAIIYARCAIGTNLDQAAVYTVPAGKVLYIPQWSVSGNAPATGHVCVFRLRATCDIDSVLRPGIFSTKAVVGVQDSPAVELFPDSIKIPAMADIEIDVFSDAAGANATCTGSFSGWIENP